MRACCGGCIGFARRRAPTGRAVQLLGSGTMLGEVLKAADILERELSVAADVWSVTSFSELARDGVAVETLATRRARHDRAYVTAQLARPKGRS